MLIEIGENMKQLINRKAALVGALLGLSLAGIAVSPANAASIPATSTQPASISDAVTPDLAPGTIALCNSGFGDVSVDNYQAKGIGKIDLFCGDGTSGYIHIRNRHESQWATVVPGSNWDDIMDFSVRQSVQTPSSGYPKNIGSNKYCYSTPIQIKNSKGVVVKTYHPTVIVSVNNKKVITAYPTTSAPNCTSGD